MLSIARFSVEAVYRGAFRKNLWFWGQAASKLAC
jgi:hypothetical protein